MVNRYSTTRNIVAIARCRHESDTLPAQVTDVFIVVIISHLTTETSKVAMAMFHLGKLIFISDVILCTCTTCTAFAPTEHTP